MANKNNMTNNGAASLALRTLKRPVESSSAWTGAWEAAAKRAAAKDYMKSAVGIDTAYGFKRKK